MQLPDSWSLEPFELPGTWCVSVSAYALNRKAIARHFAQRAAESELYAYGHYAPAAILAYPGPACTSCATSMGGVGRELRHRLAQTWRAGYQAIETPWRSPGGGICAQRSQSRLIANSRFMAAELRKIAPDARWRWCTDGRLRSDSQGNEQVPQGAVDTRGVIMVGNTILKGTDVFLRVAASLPRDVLRVRPRI